MSMKVLDHKGFLFDTQLQQTLVRAIRTTSRACGSIKNSVLFDSKYVRRDQNFWNYNLFLNPFNPRSLLQRILNEFITSTTLVPMSGNALKRMQGLQFETPSSIPLDRLGFSNNVDVGPAFRHSLGPAARYRPCCERQDIDEWITVRDGLPVSAKEQRFLTIRF